MNHVRAIALAALVVGLAGCGTVQQIQTVKVPVPVECREQVPDRPAMPTDALTVATPLLQKIKAALAELELREGYEIQLLAALQGCTRPIGRRGQ